MANSLVEFSNSLADAVEHAGRSVVGIVEGGRHGVSGTVWRSGVVVAADHTIRGRKQVTVVLPNGETTTGTVAGGDVGSDLAAINISTNTLPAVEIADANQARVGHIVLAVGRRGGDGLSASHGVIGALGGPWRNWQGGRMDRRFRLDLVPYPGFSGGPLIDAQGRVLGINTSGPRGTVLTIPAATVDRVITQLLEKGHVTRGFLGAGVQPVQLPASAGQDLGEQREVGLLVVAVTPDGPAERSGLLVGDVLIAIDGRSLAGPADLQPSLDPEKVGNPVQVKLLRGGKPMDLSVVIGERPPRQ